MPVTDLILENANVITLDPRQPTAELVAIKGDKILLVAGNEELESVRGAKTKVIDCQGKTVVPGFNDAHCHVFPFARGLISVDLSPSAVSSISDIKAAISRKAQNTPAGQWIVGTGYNEFFLAEKRPPTRWDIDEVAPNHPVILCQFALHPCVLNSLALSIAGITKETPDLPAMPIIRDPNTGEPTGLLPEGCMHIQEKVMPPLSEAELTKGITLANEHYLSQGITSLQDASVVNSLSQWQQFRHLKDTDKLKSRVYMMLGMEALSQFQEAGLTLGSGDSQLRLGGAKRYVLQEPNGQPYPPQPELNQQVLDAHRAGFQVALHATQENTVEAAIIALEYALSQLPQADRRHRIEHCVPCPPRLLERLKKLQVVPVTQPTWLYYSGDRLLVLNSAEHRHWVGWLKVPPVKSLLSSGVIVAVSSDCPVVPDNPLVGIYAAVTRKTKAGQQIQPEESISAGQALALYTINAAYASYEEDIKGSITQGKLADMVLLSDDPTKVPPEHIKDIKVEMTIIGGKVVWEA